MKIRYNVQRALQRFQIETLRKEQIKPINSILDRNDTFVVAPTSSGKSLIHCRQLKHLGNFYKFDWLPKSLNFSIDWLHCCFLGQLANNSILLKLTTVESNLSTPGINA